MNVDDQLEYETQLLGKNSYNLEDALDLTSKLIIDQLVRQLEIL